MSSGFIVKPLAPLIQRLFQVVWFKDRRQIGLPTSLEADANDDEPFEVRLDGIAKRNACVFHEIVVCFVLIRQMCRNV